MATGKRICFLPVEGWRNNMPAFEERLVEFEWFLGMSPQQKMRSSESMLSVIRETLNKLPIEVSRRSSDVELGVKLSAFNLDYKGVKLESYFQSCKKFNDGGPYLDLRQANPADAKLDCRIQPSDSKKPCRTLTKNFNVDNFDSGHVCKYCMSRKNRHFIGFDDGIKEWPSNPKSLFYDSIYISALCQNEKLANKIKQYDAFTDIEFNQKILYSEKKGPFNCQARSCAIFVSLSKSGMSIEQISEAVQDVDFMKGLYGNRNVKDYKQSTIFDN